MPALTATLGYGVGQYEDYFGITALTGNGSTYQLKLIKSTKTPRAKQVALAQDDEGNTISQTKWGTDTIFDATCVYHLVSGTFAMNSGGTVNADGNAMKTNGTPANTLLFLGKVSAGAEGVPPVYEAMIESIDIKTSNGSWPEVTVKGVFNTAGISSLFALTPTFSVMDFTLYGRKTAQLMGATLSAGSKATGSGYSLTGNLSYHEDTGAVLAIALTGAVHKVSGDAVEVTVAPTFTAAGLFVAGDIIQKPGRDATATTYGVASFEAQLDYGKDTAS
jgi:hypothetical protein